MNFINFAKSLNEAGADSGLIIGKFRVLTKAHTQLINDALKQFGKASIVVVTGKATMNTQELRYNALKAAFGNNKNVEIIQNVGSLWVPDLVPKCAFNPVALFCGTDRVKAYTSAIDKGGLNIQVIETKRGDEDISATKVIANLNDQTFFEKNTPTAVHHLYNEYVKHYSELMSESYDIFDIMDDCICEEEYRPSNNYQDIYPATDYDDDDVRVPGDNENFDVYNTVSGDGSDLAPTVDCAELKQGSCVFDCPEVNEEDGEGDSVGTGTADIATVDNVIGGMVKRKKPETIAISEHRDFASYF